MLKHILSRLYTKVPKVVGSISLLSYAEVQANLSFYHESTYPAYVGTWLNENASKWFKMPAAYMTFVFFSSQGNENVWVCFTVLGNGLLHMDRYVRS